MRSCDYEQDIGPYLDGQLPPEASRVIRDHLEHCDSCQLEARRLETISRLVRSATVPTIPTGLLDDLHQRARRAGAQGVFRMAEWLTGAAAAIIIACALVLGLTGTGDDAVALPSDWELTALGDPVDPTSTEPQQIARWLVEDLSEESSR